MCCVVYYTSLLTGATYFVILLLVYRSLCLLFCHFSCRLLPWFMQALPSEACAKGGAGAYSSALQQDPNDPTGARYPTVHSGLTRMTMTMMMMMHTCMAMTAIRAH
jgi:hypothetical protein